MVPTAAVVSGPGSRISLAACVSRAREYEGAHIGIELQQPFKCCARIFHTVDVVNLGMRGCASLESRLIDAMDNIERHGLIWAIEDRWLIHVIPKAGNAHVLEVSIECAPPRARLLLREVGEDAGTGPNDAGIDGAIRILYKVVAGNAAVIRCIVLIWDVGDVQICNGNDVEVLGLELGDHSGEIGKALAIDGEGSVFVL